jgi:predicted ATPase
MQRWAYPEALSYLRRGLEVLQALPDTAERHQQELEYHLAVGLALSVTQGLGAPETGEAYARAQALCQHVGDQSQHLSVLWGLHRFHFGRGELQTAQVLGAQCLSVAQRLQDPTLLAEAHAALGLVAFILGKLATAQGHFAPGMASYDAKLHHTHMARYGRDPGIVCLVYGALAHWLLGAPDHAMTAMHQALALANTVEHPMSRGNTLAQAALLHLLRGEAQAGQARATAALTLATAYGLATVVALGTVLESVARAAQEPRAEGLAQLQQSLAAWQATGQEPGRLLVLALAAEQYGRAGQAEAGLRLLTAALASLHNQGPRLWEAELYRVRGTLLLQTGDRALESEVETCFQQALTLARRQGARSFELRAAIGLSRLWQQQGKPAAARALLAPLYGCFTEGLYTADLQEARTLLAALAG